MGENGSRWIGEPYIGGSGGGGAHPFHAVYAKTLTK